MIYILEFEKPLGNERHSARYYVGYCYDGTLARRLKQHRAGTGAAITRAAVERGIAFNVLVTAPGDRAYERQIKRQKNTPRLIARLRKKGII